MKPFYSFSIFFLCSLNLIFIFSTKEDGFKGFDFSGFMIWNILPILISSVTFILLKGYRASSNSFLHMTFAILLLHGLLHGVMFFDFNNVRTGSSTSALSYIFIPIYSLGFGAITYFMSKLSKRVFSK